MAVGDLPIFALAKAKMSHLNARARVVSQNIANVDTPKYRAQDVEALDFAAVLKSETRSTGGGMRATNERHMTGSSERVSDFKIETADDEHEGLDGNTVSVQDQMMKAADTQMKYAMATSLYRKGVGMIRTALGRGQG